MHCAKCVQRTGSICANTRQFATSDKSVQSRPRTGPQQCESSFLCGRESRGLQFGGLVFSVLTEGAPSYMLIHSQGILLGMYWQRYSMRACAFLFAPRVALFRKREKEKAIVLNRKVTELFCWSPRQGLGRSRSLSTLPKKASVFLRMSAQLNDFSYTPA